MSFILVVFSTLFSALLGFLRYKYNYWELQGVPQVATNFLFGTLTRLKSIHQSELYHEVYAQFKGKSKLAGTYLFVRPIAVVLDLDLAKTILIKEFTKFVDRFDRRVGHDNIFSANLFSLCGEKWRALRTKLTPTFTSAKMKFMFPTLLSVAGEFDAAFARQLAASPDGCVEMHDMNGRFTTDVIGNCAFGIECNSLKNPEVEFRRIGRLVFYPNFISVRWRLLQITYMRFFMNMLSWMKPKRENDIESFIKRIVRETVETRERHNIKRNDFINLLIDIKNTNGLDNMPGLTIEQVAAQVFIFFIAGFETSSSNMSFALYELAKNPEKQEKCRAEIKSVLAKHNGELTYEAMMEMHYLDMVISETLRKYPALAALTRITQEDFEVPDTDIIIEKGTRVCIPVKEIHYDPDIYDNPHEFRPERFTPEEVQKRHPQAFLGFGDGPRNCIGLRFGRMQSRVGLITLLKSYQFRLSTKTPDIMPIGNQSIVLVPKGGVWIKAEKL